MVPQP
jgi:hypothetical protein